MYSHRINISPPLIRSYLFGFNGQLKDNEVYGEGNSYTAEFWQYDPRIGRRWNRDPIWDISWSPYSVFIDNPIVFADPLGNTVGYGDKATKKEVKKAARNNKDFRKELKKQQQDKSTLYTYINDPDKAGGQNLLTAKPTPVNSPDGGHIDQNIFFSSEPNDMRVDVQITTQQKVSVNIGVELPNQSRTSGPIDVNNGNPVHSITPISYSASKGVLLDYNGTDKNTAKIVLTASVSDRIYNYYMDLRRKEVEFWTRKGISENTANSEADKHGQEIGIGSATFIVMGLPYIVSVGLTPNYQYNFADQKVTKASETKYKVVKILPKITINVDGAPEKKPEIIIKY